MSSINDPLCCGFIKASIYGESRSGKTLSTQFAYILSLFPNLPLTENSFKCRSKKVVESVISLGKTSQEKLENFLKTFSVENWQGLTVTISLRHGTYECKGCLVNEKYRLPLSFLPIKKGDKAAKRKAEEKGLFVTVKRKILEAVNSKVTELNHEFKENYALSFEAAQKLVGKTEERKKRSEIVREVKENLKEQWAETAVVR